jgi:hypothetical protein
MAIQITRSVLLGAFFMFISTDLRTGDMKNDTDADLQK